MLIQSLVIIAAMVVISGAILTSTLVTAKASLHQTLLAKTQTAMNDATAAFVLDAAKNVKKYGTEQPWPEATPMSETLCGSGLSSGATCPFLAVANWHVTGRTSSAIAFTENGALATASDARNLAATIDEQRISATIAVRVTDPSGKTLMADRSRFITARVLNAAPYVVITGSREASALSGSIAAAEGDTAGTAPIGLKDNTFAVESPSPKLPAKYIDTRIRTSVDCRNSQETFDQADPLSNLDDGRYIDHSIRNFGNQDWAYETPCMPTYPVDDSQAPSGYATPAGSVYLANPALRDNVWKKNNANRSSFAR